MVDLKKVIPAITLDLKYAATDNFMHPPVRTTFLRKPAADELKKVTAEDLSFSQLAKLKSQTNKFLIFFFSAKYTHFLK
jgi:D-alanyl-D-alanine dipeptidase